MGNANDDGESLAAALGRVPSGLFVLTARDGHLRRVERALLHPTREHPRLAGPVARRQDEQAARDAPQSGRERLRVVRFPHLALLALMLGTAAARSQGRRAASHFR